MKKGSRMDTPSLYKPQLDHWTFANWALLHSQMPGHVTASCYNGPLPKMQKSVNILQFYCNNRWVCLKIVVSQIQWFIIMFTTEIWKNCENKRNQIPKKTPCLVIKPWNLSSVACSYRQALDLHPWTALALHTRTVQPGISGRRARFDLFEELHRLGWTSPKIGMETKKSTKISWLNSDKLLVIIFGCQTV